MRVVHLLRKPCSEGTVAANVLRWGTGAVNVDGCRIPTSDRLDGGHSSAGQQMSNGWRRPWMNDPEAVEANAARSRAAVEKAEALGRWPANLVLQHLDGCRQEGTRKVKDHTGYPNGPGGKSTPMHGWGQARSVDVRPNSWVGHADPDGTETVAAWACAEGCPVSALDAQSGVLPARGNVNPSTRGGGAGFSWSTRPIASEHHTRPELRVAGGASRFFKHFGGKGEP